MNFCGVTEESDRFRLALFGELLHQCERFIKTLGREVDLLKLQPSLDSPRIDFDEKSDTTIECDRLCLRSTHLAETGSQNELSRQSSPSLLTCKRSERLICTLKNSLRTDVDPTSRGHLTVHHQTFAFIFVELLLRRPMRNDVRIREKHARGILVCSEYSNGLSGLHEQCLVGFQVFQ